MAIDSTMSARYAWLNGEIVPWDQCVVHARSQGAFWGANVFEGVRAYWNADGPQLYALRLDEHLARLRQSARSVRMPIRYSDDDLRKACSELVRANDFECDLHVVVVAYFDLSDDLNALSYTENAGMHITAVPMRRRAGYSNGVSACISSWRRINDDAMPPRIKTGANYHNSRLAHHEAVRNGYDTTFLLNQRGHLTEAPSACVVIVRDGRLVTPPATSGVLEGITVASVAEIGFEELGVSLDRRDIDRAELYIADEIFVCGTLAEVLPVVSVDRLPVGDGTPGPLSRTLQESYDRVVRGPSSRRDWLTPLYP